LRYDGDLTDREWEIIAPIFMRANKGRHFQKHNKRELVNAVRYISKTGCQWRYYLKSSIIQNCKLILCTRHKKWVVGRNDGFTGTKNTVECWLRC
jgi:transposase